MRKSPGHVPWVRALSLIMCKEDPLKLYKIEFATVLIKWFLNGRLVKMIFFSEIYIEKEQTAGAKYDQATRKYPGHITWVRALGIFLCKEDPLKLYKIEFALELVKWF
jgi:phosphorylcholine metabolism protein LicD